MYRRILIANRADCAFRLIQACQKLNISPCLIASRDDPTLHALSPYVENIVFTGIGPDAYLNQDNILEAARHLKCEAILPGWGFLSENAAFARRTRLMNLDFIGPTSNQIQAFGDKLKTLRILADAMDSPPQAVQCHEPNALDQIISRIPPPYMLKNRFGGGGKNITFISSPQELEKRFALLVQSGQQYQFYVEHAFSNARHIECQFFGNGKGNVLFLGARDCSAQLNHQKWLELTFDIHSAPRLEAQATKVAQILSQLNYLGWGTVEFLIDQTGVAHLLELNPRLQVEHAITEMTAGIDLVQMAISQAYSGNTTLPPNPPCHASAHEQAIEFRLFARSAGTLKSIGFTGFPWPHHPLENDPNYRLETAYQTGDVITGEYDGLLARFILYAPNGDARDKLINWLASFQLDGLSHNLDDLRLYSPINTDVR